MTADNSRLAPGCWHWPGDVEQNLACFCHQHHGCTLCHAKQMLATLCRFAPFRDASWFAAVGKAWGHSLAAGGRPQSTTRSKRQEARRLWSKPCACTEALNIAGCAASQPAILDLPSPTDRRLGAPHHCAHVLNRHDCLDGCVNICVSGLQRPCQCASSSLEPLRSTRLSCQRLSSVLPARLLISRHYTLPPPGAWSVPGLGGNLL